MVSEAAAGPPTEPSALQPVQHSVGSTHLFVLCGSKKWHDMFGVTDKIPLSEGDNGMKCTDCHVKVTMPGSLL